MKVNFPKKEKAPELDEEKLKQAQLEKEKEEVLSSVPGDMDGKSESTPQLSDGQSPSDVGSNQNVNGGGGPQQPDTNSAEHKAETPAPKENNNAAASVVSAKDAAASVADGATRIIVMVLLAMTAVR
ncbi:hypothetical protein DQ04_23591000 [Trypanosoma grayi]|uniref:hypothetical protein n=1 Tax=Trypanosoma grayi TaxID=71804 RepID=UPI0004F46361|nr:hypothetical protein DQ04_23591000 [Trypanosoma grayi]KEG05321.1 hypothetical protein DQ04_23591000 [Trypanosoma grayi]